MPAPYPQQPIPIEALSEYDVREILLDGHEILEKPLTPAENFQRIVNQIDFTEDPDDEDCCVQRRETDMCLTKPMSPKLWENMRETMRMTLIEINALVDILAVIREGKYLAINPVADDPPDISLPLYLAGKKRALAAAADILLKGAERLRRRHTELFDARIRLSNPNTSVHSEPSNSNSFHKALMHLRKEWRLKLHQNSILGDVSLRSVGSRFREPGNFEIRESDLFANHKPGMDNNEVQNTDTLSGVEVVFSRSMEALLNTSVGSGILEIRYYESDINSGPTPLWQSTFGENQDKHSCFESKSPIPLTQRRRLFKAQRVLACREILFLLACEACGSRGHDSILTDSVAFATQGEIIATLFPGVQISISMVTKNPISTCDDHDMKKKKRDCEEKSPLCCCNNTIGLQLHRILAAQHRVAWSNLASLPQPACGPIQVPAHHRAGGAHALPASSFSPSLGDPLGASGFSIAVAGVAGFAAPAASIWSTTNSTLKSHSNIAGRPDPFNTQRSNLASACQDRLSLFTEWGNFQTVGSGYRPLGAQNIDDSVPGASAVAMMEHTLFSRGADDGALKSVIGSNPSLFNRTIAMCRHYYLREKTSIILSNFCCDSPVKTIVRWDGINSAFQTSARICFYSVDYDVYRSWLGITITPTGVTIFYSDPPRTYRLGTDLNRLTDVLSNQAMHTQIHFIDMLATKILGWTRLGNNPFSGIGNPDESGDGPMVVKMFSSPSAKHIVCLRASASVGLRLFVAENNNSDQILLDHMFREVKLSSVYGKHAVAKIESIMTVLS